MSGTQEFSASREKFALQVFVTAGSLVPITAGAGGVLFGPAFLGDSTAPADLDGQFRYLSGLLLGIGLAYATAVPGIEAQRKRLLLLGGIVVIGGVSRLLSMLARGVSSPVMIGAVAMELVVTPIVTLWQFRVTRSTR